MSNFKVKCAFPNCEALSDGLLCPLHNETVARPSETSAAKESVAANPLKFPPKCDRAGAPTSTTRQVTWKPMSIATHRFFFSTTGWAVVISGHFAAMHNVGYSGPPAVSRLAWHERGHGVWRCCPNDVRRLWAGMDRSRGAMGTGLPKMPASAGAHDEELPGILRLQQLLPKRALKIWNNSPSPCFTRQVERWDGKLRRGGSMHVNDCDSTITIGPRGAVC